MTTAKLTLSDVRKAIAELVDMGLVEAACPRCGNNEAYVDSPGTAACTGCEWNLTKDNVVYRLVEKEDDAD